MKTQRYYSTDVRTLSDQELDALSVEIAEAFDVYDELYEDTQEVERYWEMRAEIGRRRPATGLGSPIINPSIFARMALESLLHNQSVCRDICQSFDQEFSTP